MDQITSEALEKSITHWENMETGKEPCSDYGSSYCALCALFYNSDCVNCPIKLKTGKKVCDGSPYPAYTDVTSPENARKMKDFLISLREKEEVMSRIEVIHEEQKPAPAPKIKEVVLHLTPIDAKKLREALGSLQTCGHVYDLLEGQI